MKQLLQRRDFWILGAASALLAIMLAIRGAGSQVVTSKGSSPTQSPPSQTAEQRIANQGDPIDTNHLAAETEHWLTWGGSDPFGQPAPPKTPPSTDPFVGFDQLHLLAVWRQPTQQLAVINQRIVSIGGLVGSFRLEHCEADAVWLSIPGASRRLRLEPLAPPINLAPPLDIRPGSNSTISPAR